MVIFGGQKYKIGQDARENDGQKTACHTGIFLPRHLQSLKLELQQARKIIRKISFLSKETEIRI